MSSAELTGTEKQIAWAEEVRNTLLWAVKHWKAGLDEDPATEAEKAPVYASLAAIVRKIEACEKASWFCQIGSDYKIGKELDFKAAASGLRAIHKGWF